MKNKEQKLLEEAYEQIVESTYSQGGFTRIAHLALQGRYDEASSDLDKYVTDPITNKQIADYLKTIKPIEGATTSKLAQDPKVEEWIQKHWLPFIKRIIDKENIKKDNDGKDNLPLRNTLRSAMPWNQKVRI